MKLNGKGKECFKRGSSFDEVQEGKDGVL